MIIDLSDSREQYFVKPSVAQIKYDFLQESGAHAGRLRDVPGVVVGTREGDLEGLLRREYTADSKRLVDQLEALGEDELLVLPPEYRIGGDDLEAQSAVAYENNYVNLDSVHVKRKLLEGEVADQYRPLSGRQKRAHQWDPERVLAAAFDLLGENQEFDQVHQLYSWRSKDARKLVSLERSVEGLELRMFQNLAFFKVAEHVLLHKRRLVDGAFVDDDEYERFFQKADRYEKLMGNEPFMSLVRRLDVDERDLVTYGNTHSDLTGWELTVPSRSQRGKRHLVTIRNFPVVRAQEESDRHFSRVWDLIIESHAFDAPFRSGRRRRDLDSYTREDFFDAPSIAAFWTPYNVLKRSDDFQEPLSPFVIPQPGFVDKRHKLIHQTVLLDYDDETKRWSTRALNMTERENIGWKVVARDGFKNTFTTRLSNLSKNPYAYVVQLRG